MISALLPGGSSVPERDGLAACFSVRKVHGLTSLHRLVAPGHLAEDGV
jgi:hypothetical protein